MTHQYLIRLRNGLRLVFLISSVFTFFLLAVLTVVSVNIESPAPPILTPAPPILTLTPGPVRTEPPTTGTPNNNVQVTPTPLPTVPQASEPTKSETSLYILSGISLFTSLSSFIGFISTTIVTWRKEKRESKSATLDYELKKAQLTKIQKELEDKQPTENTKEKPVNKKNRKDRR